MVLYYFQTSLFFGKNENLSLMFSGKLVILSGVILILTTSYLKTIKPV